MKETQKELFLQLIQGEIKRLLFVFLYFSRMIILINQHKHRFQQQMVTKLVITIDQQL